MNPELVCYMNITHQLALWQGLYRPSITINQMKINLTNKIYINDVHSRRV